MNIRRLMRISLPVLVLALLIGVMALDAPTAQAIARYDGPGHWITPPGWSYHNGFARYDGPGHWTTPPGWSYHNGLAWSGYNWGDKPGTGSPWQFPHAPGWNSNNTLAWSGYNWGDKPGNGSPWQFPHAPGWPGA